MTAQKGVITVDYNKYPVLREFSHKGAVFGTLSPCAIAFDPGETTGWSLMMPKSIVSPDETEVTLNHAGTHVVASRPVVLGIDAGEIILHKHGQIDCGRGQGELNSDDENNPGLNPEGECAGIARMVQLCDEYPNAVVVVEDFIVNFNKIDKSRAALSPVRITAKLEQELWQRGRRIFVQSTSIKSTMNDERLKELGRYQRAGGLNHARDADRHALHWLRRCQTSAELRHKSWPWLFDPPIAKVTKKRKPKPPGARINFG